MSISCEVIPWDLEGFGLYNRQFPSVNSLDEAARLMTSPADSVMAWEEGERRALTAAEEAELRGHQDRILLQGRRTSNLCNE
jgi:hypothetical protein